MPRSITINELCEAIRVHLTSKPEGEANEIMSQLLAVIEPGEHMSDCAHHNSPAYAPGLCDCKE